MIRLLWCDATGLGVTIMPPLAERAMAVTARSVSSASRTLTAVSSIRNDGAAAWIAANCPMPEAMLGSRRTAARVTRRDLFEQLQPFYAHAIFKSGEPGRVATRPRQARDETGADRVDSHREHDRHGAGRLQQRGNGCSAGAGNNDVGRERGQFGRVSAKAVGVGRGPARLDLQVAAGSPAQLLQALQERRDADLCVGIVRGQGHEHADALHSLGLLRARRDRPGRCRAAEQGYQLASSYVRHGLPLGTRWDSLLHLKVAAEGTDRSLG